MDKHFDITSIIGLIVTLSAAFVGLYGQYKDPETGLIIFISILIFILLFYLVSWPVNYLKIKLSQVDSNRKVITNISKDLNNLKNKLDINRRLTKLELENENNKKEK